MKAAVESYFGIPLEEITPAQAAIIAGLPKSPSNYDLVRNAIELCKTDVAEDAECPVADTKLVVPDDATVVERRDQILGLLAEGRTPMSGDTYSAADFKAAAKQEVLLARQTVPRWVAPHFVWAVLDELAVKLCAGEATCDAVADGRAPGDDDPGREPAEGRREMGQGGDDRAAHEGPGRHGEAPRPHLRAVDEEPRRTRTSGTEPSSRRTTRRARSSPTSGARTTTPAPAGSRSSRSTTWPARATASPARRSSRSTTPWASTTTRITAGSMIMDSATDFGGGYTPNDADLLERGPVRVRNALQFSLNIPSVKVGAINGTDHVFAKAKEFGMEFQTDTPSAGPVPRPRCPGGQAGRSDLGLRRPGERRSRHRSHDDPDRRRTARERTSPIRMSRRKAPRS